jgi:hypothetical protein
MAALLGVSTATVKDWYHAGIVSGQRYNDKGETLYDPPDPGNPPDRPKTGRPPRTPDQHQHNKHPNQPEGVQYAT